MIPLPGDPPPYPFGIVGLARSAATLVQYRRPGQRGSPYLAYVPGDVFDPDTARADLVAVVGEIAGDVVILGVLRHAAPASAPAAARQPLTEIEPAPQPASFEPVIDHPSRWQVEAPPFEVRPGIVLDVGKPSLLVLPGLARIISVAPIDSLFAAAGRLLLPQGQEWRMAGVAA